MTQIDRWRADQKDIIGYVDEKLIKRTSKGFMIMTYQHIRQNITKIK